MRETPGGEGLNTMALSALSVVNDVKTAPHECQFGRRNDFENYRQVRLHNPPHSIANQNKAKEVGMASPVTGRTTEHKSAFVQERELAKEIASALVVDFGHYRSTHKTIAQRAGVSPETVKKWIAADSAPSLVYFLRLLPHSPALQAVVRKLSLMESELDPHFQQAFAAFMQMVGKR
jgi:hypothetical protein